MLKELIEAFLLIFAAVMEDRLVLITPNSSKYPDENFSHISKDILFNENILFREEGSGTRDLVENIFEKAKIPMSKFNVTAYIEDTETIKELVSLGVGVSFLSEKAIVSDLALGKYKVFYIDGLDFTRKFYFAYHKNRQLSPLSEAFKNYILNYVEDQIK